MKAQCPNCKTTYRIPDERIPAGGAGIKVRCKRCGTVIDLKREESGATPLAEPQPERWFVAIGSEKRGPLSRDQVSALIRTGEVGAETYVWKKGFADWMRLAEVADLAGELSAAAKKPEHETGTPAAGEAWTGEAEPTVLEPVPTAAFAAVSEPQAAAPAAAEAGQPGSVFESQPQDEDSQTQMIWQRRETSVLFSLDDYKTRRKTRSIKPGGAADVVRVEPVQPSEPAAAAAEPRKATERVSVISLDEAEIKRVAEVLSRRQRRRAMIRNGAIGLGVLGVLVAAVVWFAGRQEPPAPAPPATPPAPVAAAVQPEPVKPSQPAPAAVAPEPAPAPAPATAAPATAEASGKAAKGARTAPSTGSASPKTPKAASRPAAPEPGAAPAAEKPAAKPGPATDDVNALLANLRSGQGAEQKGGSGGEAAAGGSDLPEQLTMSQIQSVLRKQQGAVEGCVRQSGAAAGSTVRVSTTLTIEGSGRVASVSVSNAGPAEGCIRSALSRVSFPKFRKPSMTVPYPFTVQP